MRPALQEALLVLHTWSKTNDLGDPRSQREPTTVAHGAKLPSKQMVYSHRSVLFSAFVREASFGSG